MEITIGACLLAKRNMKINTGHEGKANVHIVKASVNATGTNRYEQFSRNCIVLHGMVKSTFRVWCLFLFLFATGAKAQTVWLGFHYTDSIIPDEMPVRIAGGKEQMQQLLQKKIRAFQQRNYFEASVDSLLPYGDTTVAYIHLGRCYTLLTGTDAPGGKSELMASSIRKQMLKSMEELQNKGYPFAIVSLHSTELDAHELHVVLDVDSGPRIRYDTLIITGTAVQDPVFMMRFLSVKPGGYYDERSIQRMDKKLRQLTYLTVARPSYVLFYDRKAKPVLCINERPASSFEGIIGIRNDEVNARQFKLTGEAGLHLSNLLQTAASLSLQWRRVASENSDLRCRVYYPFLLGTSLAVDNEFWLYRQDSSFQRIKNNLAIQYLFDGLNALAFYYMPEKSTVTLNDAQRAEALISNRIPDVNDYLNKNYGVKFLYRNLNAPFNPVSGNDLLFDFNTGTHKILPNASLQNASRPGGGVYTAYDSVQKSTLMFQGFARADAYIPITRHHVLNVFSQSATMYHERLLYNEQYQLGGLKTFRGVNELSIRATTYTMLRAEYRYMLAQSGYLALFGNAIWYESKLVNGYASKTLLGAGGGLGLQTKGGILSVMYAIANQNEFTLQNGKVHIGFTAVF